MEERVTLISEQEAPGSGATADDAAAFLEEHSVASKVQWLHVSCLEVGTACPVMLLPHLLCRGPAHT